MVKDCGPLIHWQPGRLGDAPKLCRGSGVEALTLMVRVFQDAEVEQKHDVWICPCSSLIPAFPSVCTGTALCLYV